jgi:hypothetical protein
MAGMAGRPVPSLRWIVVHMIGEYARHNGHADLLRESIDGQTEGSPSQEDSIRPGATDRLPPPAHRRLRGRGSGSGLSSGGKISADIAHEWLRAMGHRRSRTEPHVRRWPASALAARPAAVVPRRRRIQGEAREAVPEPIRNREAHVASPGLLWRPWEQAPRWSGGPSTVAVVGEERAYCSRLVRSSRPMPDAYREGGPPNRWRHDEHGHEDGHAVPCAARCR